MRFLGDAFWLTAVFFAGCLAAFAVMPDPPTRNECVTYKIAQKTATAFVLKPPPPIEHVTVVKEACPMPQPAAEPVSETIETKAEEKPRHRRHRRHRRHW